MRSFATGRPAPVTSITSIVRRLALCSGIATAGMLLCAPSAYPNDYEVWVSDQVNTQGFSAQTPDGTHGGKVRIYDGADLEHSPPINDPLVLDATADLFPNAEAMTGAHVARIHGILPTPLQGYMALNFVASGHLGIVTGRTKRAVCLFRTTGTSTGRQNHMSFWAPDGRRLIVANQNGRMLERVDVSRNSAGFATGFHFNAAASLDLVGGTGRVTAQPVAVDMDPNDGIACTLSGVAADGQPTHTPNGVLKQAPGIRPLNTVICPLVSSTNRHAFVTLGGGGMFVVDITATPMAIVAEYDLSVIRAAGCGGIQAAGFMNLNTGTPGPNISEFSLYRLELNYPSAPAFFAPNRPLPVSVFADPDNGKLAGVDLPAGTNRDAHGMVLVRRIGSSEPHVLHQFDRIRNRAEVFHARPGDVRYRRVGSYSMTESGACGTTPGATKSNDPTPDLADASPHGERIYVALRGPFPLTISHAADGSCPGLGIVDLSNSQHSGRLIRVLPTMQLNADGSRNLSDPHAAIIRRK